jgi:hypothetical protein
LWVADLEFRGDRGRLFLLQDDSRTPDKETRRWSSYSSLYALYEEAQTRREAGFRQQYDELSEKATADNFSKKFADDPIAVLKEMGATITTPRFIEALYRVRFWHSERSLEMYTRREWYPIVFGYPIFIAAV